MIHLQREVCVSLTECSEFWARKEKFEKRSITQSSKNGATSPFFEVHCFTITQFFRPIHFVDTHHLMNKFFDSIYPVHNFCSLVTSIIRAA